MRGSILARARNGGLLYMDGGISEERKRQWLTKKLKRDDVLLMREMKSAGWSIRYIGRIFGIERRMCWLICTGQAHRDA